MRETFRIKLAGQVIEVHGPSPRLRRFCADYLTDERAGLVIELRAEDIAFEREGSPEGNEAAWETAALCRRVAEALIARNVLLFHGSALSLDGAAYVFTALSGTGKSTHARRWREAFDGVQMINDDKPLLRLCEEELFVCSSPWDGKHRLSANIEAPLKAICFLERDGKNSIERISPQEALAVFLQQSYRPREPEALAAMLALAVNMTKKTEFYRLRCNAEPEAARVAYEGMGGKAR